MFGGGTLAVVHNAGALSVRTEDRDALLAVIRSSPRATPSPSSSVAEWGPRSRADKARRGRRGAGGKVKGIESPKEGALAAWIESEGRDRGIRFAPGAAKELATRVGGFVREGDAERRDQTRRASMEIDKLGLYRSDGPVSVDDVRALVAEAVPGSAWALADAVAEREPARRCASSTPSPSRCRSRSSSWSSIAGSASCSSSWIACPARRTCASAAMAMGIKSDFRARRLAEQARKWQPRSWSRPSTACWSSTRS